MKKEIIKLLNDQINKEFYSAYLYLGISNFYSKMNLEGFASWYKVQAQEEQEHAMKIYDYLVDKGLDVTLDKIEAVNIDLKDALDAAKEADKHEKYITGEIVKIMNAAVKAGDYGTQIFLNWFITEQEEEEKNSEEMIAKIELLGNDKKQLYLLDKELGSRKG
ncbi:MAG: ferritin [Butyrivibrio sp.]|nr:ferritin [Butyrivibrio sp.]